MRARPASGALPAGSHDLARRVSQRLEAVLRHATEHCRAHGARLARPEVRFDLTGQSAGQVRWERGRPPVMRFNLAIARAHPDDFLAVTVVHEVAHLVVAACHPGARPHGPEWRATMRLLGVADPRRCHQYALPTPARRQRRWAYRCGCREHQLTTTRHKRVEAGTVRYHCRVCGGPLHPVEA